LSIPDLPRQKKRGAHRSSACRRRPQPVPSASAASSDTRNRSAQWCRAQAVAGPPPRPCRRRPPSQRLGRWSRFAAQGARFTPRPSRRSALTTSGPARGVGRGRCSRSRSGCRAPCRRTSPGPASASTRSRTSRGRQGPLERQAYVDVSHLRARDRLDGSAGEAQATDRDAHRSRRCREVEDQARQVEDALRFPLPAPRPVGLGGPRSGGKLR
jgi:hypothetical protein